MSVPRREPAATPSPEKPLERHALVRQAHEQAILETLFRRSPVTRAQLARLTGVSKPTAGAVVAALEQTGLVTQVGRTNGHVGRSAAVFSLNPRFGHVVALDVGATKLRAAVSDLFGEILRTTVVRTASAGESILEQMVRQARAICADAGAPWSTVRNVVVGAPGVLDRSSDHLALAPNVHGLRSLPLSSALRRRLGVRIVVENDVNLSAVGERWQGCATNCDDFVFLSVGTGIGMGIVMGGELFRGSRGAAGEVSFLPIGGDPFDRRTRRHGALESAASGSAIRAAARRLRADHPQTVLGPRASAQQIFAAAVDGDELGRRVLADEARMVALAVLAACAVLDPQMVVLGGGVGANPALLEPVRAALVECTPFDVRVETTRLGERAALLGALAVGVDDARVELLERLPS
jgi:predicted NBD/HSP70 family sugar kinase